MRRRPCPDHVPYVPPEWATTEVRTLLSNTTDRLKICIAAETYAPEVNGAAKFAERLADGLAKHGHEVHVICPSPSGMKRTEVIDGVSVHYVKSVHWPLHPTWMIVMPWQAAPAVREVLDAVKPDVVHTQAHFVIGRYAITESKRRGIPLVATNHFMPENVAPYLKLPELISKAGTKAAWADLKRLFQKADYITVPTQLAADLLTANGFTKKIRPVSCGIDLSRFTKACTSGRAQETGSHAPTALFVGRLSAEKHTEDIIRAVAATDPALNIHAEIVGAGEQEQYLYNLAKELGVGDRVKLLGKINEDQLVAAYQRCTFFCMPSTAELQSIATLEALSSAKPVVLADAVALPHLVRDGSNGYLVEPRNTEALAQAFEKLARASADELAAMGAVSQEIARTHDLKLTINTFEDIYRSVIGSETR